MAKSVHNDILDAALNHIKNNVTEMTLCSQEPTTFTEAHTTYKLADVALTSGDFTGPADGDTSGRKITVDAQSSIPIDATGTATHVALTLTASSQLQYITTCTNQALVSGNQTNTAAWDIELRDPS